MLVAEAIFLAIDRRVWHWNLVAETYRLIDLGVMLVLFAGLALPVFFEKDSRRRRVVYLIVALAGVGGAIAFVLLRGLIAGIA